MDVNQKVITAFILLIKFCKQYIFLYLFITFDKLVMIQRLLAKPFLILIKLLDILVIFREIIKINLRFN